MALTLAQYEEVVEVLRMVSRLADELEARHNGFSDDVLDWLKRAELVLTNNRLPDVSRIAACRVRLIAAGRGVVDDVVIVGRISVRKVKEATAASVLRAGSDTLQNVISERTPVFAEAERISRQMVAVAAMKGLLATSQSDDLPHPDFIRRLSDRIASDSDLASIHAHVIGLVGATDTAILLDRALAYVRMTPSTRAPDMGQ